MTSIPDLRRLVDAALEHAPRDLLAETGRSSLEMAYNSRVPDAFRVGATSGIALRVQLNDRNSTGRDLGKTTDRFARAVAALGREISDPRAPFVQLQSGDYARAPLYVTGASGSVITLSPQRAPLVMGALVAESYSQDALKRLVNLLPSGPEDDEAVEAILAARTPSMRAVREVALAAKGARGLSMQLSGAGEPVRSTITMEQAEKLDGLLADARETVDSVKIKGVVDGVRCHRRMFYLERSGLAELSGLMDEGLVERVQELLGQEVWARLEVVTTRNLAGVQQRPHYRLVGIDPVVPDQML